MREISRSGDIAFEISPEENIDVGKQFYISIRIQKSIGFIENVSILLNRFNERTGTLAFRLKFSKEDDTYAYFENWVTIEDAGVYYFCFTMLVQNAFKYIKYDWYKQSAVITNDEGLNFWKISVGFDTPEWAKGAIMYHIFVDRFNRSKGRKLVPMEGRTVHKSWDEMPDAFPDKNGDYTDFYGGDIQGIIEKLDYIQSFGVTVLYLSPIVESISNHRYDTGDYEKVDPYAGTNDDLKQLCDECHRRGMHVILDAVFNHTGSDSKYFNKNNHYNTVGAYQGPESPYYDWYQRTEQGYFDGWWGFDSLPKCNGYNPEWQNYIYGEGGVIDKWFSLGIDGLRLDVADELTDEFIENIRVAVKRNNKDGFIIGEVWDDPVAINRGYIKSAKGMDTVMDYVIADAVMRYLKYGDTFVLEGRLKSILFHYPHETLNTLMNFVSTHDISRIINVLGSNHFDCSGEHIWDLPKKPIDKENRDWQLHNDVLTVEEYTKGKDLSKLYAVIMMFLPGIFSIFYGDEVGVTGIGNILCRKPFPWGSGDSELMDFYRELGQAYSQFEFLKNANTHLIRINQDELVFERYNSKSSLCIIINRTNRERELIVPREYQDSISLRKVFALNSDYEVLGPYGAMVFEF